MTNNDVVPRKDLEGNLGTEKKKWDTLWVDKINGENAEEVIAGAVGIGAVQQFLQTSIPDGWLSLEDGIEVSRNTYPSLWAWVQENAPLITDEEWLTKAVTQKAVAYYSLGDGETTFRLPRLLGFAEGKAAKNVGELSEAGLPNITGESGVRFIMNNNVPKSGALDGYAMQSKEGCGLAFGSSSVSCGGVAMDASRSSPIYGNSITVQPESFGLVWCVKAFGAAIKQGVVNVTSLSHDVAMKANRDLSNLSDKGNRKGFPSKTWVSIPITDNKKLIYTPPANGWVQASMSASINNTAAAWLTFGNGSMATFAYHSTHDAGLGFANSIPVVKGRGVSVQAENCTITSASFIYAEGEI